MIISQNSNTSLRFLYRDIDSLFRYIVRRYLLRGTRMDPESHLWRIGSVCVCIYILYIYLWTKLRITGTK